MSTESMVATNRAVRRGSIVTHRLRNGLIALSLANLSFISAWQRRLYGTAFFSPSWSWADVLTLLLNVFLLAAIFYVLLALAAKAKVTGVNLQGLVYCIPLFAVANVVRRIAAPPRHATVFGGAVSYTFHGVGRQNPIAIPTG